MRNGYNLLSLHKLRSAFRSQLTGKMDGALIEFFMGHAICAEKRAYLNLRMNELRELYANHEKYFAIEKTSKDELSRVIKELKTKIRRLENAFTRLTEQKKEIREFKETVISDEWIELKVIPSFKALEEKDKRIDQILES